MFLIGTTFSSATGNLSPRICGINTGYHMYVDAGSGLSSDASLNAVIANSATWKIKAIKLYMLYNEEN